MILRRWLRREEKEANLERELRFHIEERVADLVRSGVSEEDARRRVRLEFGAAEHKDFGFLTFLAQDAAGGLEVRSPGGELVPVSPRADAFVVNVADMLSQITGGRFKSPLHRVVNRAGIARYSIQMFFDPDFDARFPAMPEVTAGEFLLGKFNKFYEYRKQIAASV